MSVLLVDGDTPGMTVSRDIPKLGYKGPESAEVVFDVGVESHDGLYQNPFAAPSRTR